MTKQSKPVYFRFLFIYLFILVGKFALSQVPDTIVVYDYVYITDTIWIEEPSVRDTIQYSELKSIKPELFSSETATIPESGIYKVKNQKQPEMKKAGILAGLLMAFQGCLLGQTDFLITGGINSRWVEHAIRNINHPCQTGLHVGLELYHVFSESKLGYTIGTELRLIGSPFAYKQSKPIDGSMSEFEYSFAQYKLDWLINSMNTGAINSPLAQFALPVKLNYQLTNSWQIFGGCEPSLALHDDVNFWKNSSERLFFNLGIVGGVEYSWNDHWAFRAACSQSIFEEKNISRSQTYHIYPGISQMRYRLFYSHYSIVYQF